MRRGTSGINALIGVDKPLGMTSHDVVAHVRRALGERRVGHAGTLDPDASGVLVVGVGQGTRLMGLLTAERKSYMGLVVFGSETDTDDAEGAVTRTADVPAWAFGEATARERLASLVGSFMQVPPAYSAISVNGVRSYARARAGEQVELEARPVTIHAAELVAIQNVDGACAWLCSFDVSKGCYIRAIARDLGRACGTAAHLGGLTRTSSGSISLGSCVNLERLEAEGAALLDSASLDPAACLGLPARILTAAELADAACGKRLPVGAVSSQVAEGGLVSLVNEGKLYGVWRRTGRQLVSQTNFPAGIMGVRP